MYEYSAPASFSRKYQEPYQIDNDGDYSWKNEGYYRKNEGYYMRKSTKESKVKESKRKENKGKEKKVKCVYGYRSGAEMPHKV